MLGSGLRLVAPGELIRFAFVRPVPFVIDAAHSRLLCSISLSVNVSIYIRRSGMWIFSSKVFVGNIHHLNFSKVIYICICNSTRKTTIYIMPEYTLVSYGMVIRTIQFCRTLCTPIIWICPYPKISPLCGCLPSKPPIRLNVINCSKHSVHVPVLYPVRISRKQSRNLTCGRQVTYILHLRLGRQSPTSCRATLLLI